jgi:lysine 2,3-aminomutase
MMNVFHRNNLVGRLYIYHCQSIPTTDHFVMEIKEERKIMTGLRERLSGIAFPNHVIDIQGTTGKIIVPTNHWMGQEDSILDYNGNKIKLDEYK